MKMDRLIPKLESMASNEVSDELYAIAYNVEDAFIYSGAEPGMDYTRKDLFKLAMPIFVELFKKRDDMRYTYPADDVAEFVPTMGVIAGISAEDDEEDE
jgi:hypothetical protein